MTTQVPEITQLARLLAGLVVLEVLWGLGSSTAGVAAWFSLEGPRDVLRRASLGASPLPPHTLLLSALTLLQLLAAALFTVRTVRHPQWRNIIANFEIYRQMQRRWEQLPAHLRRVQVPPMPRPATLAEVIQPWVLAFLPPCLPFAVYGLASLAIVLRVTVGVVVLVELGCEWLRWRGPRIRYVILLGMHGIRWLLVDAEWAPSRLRYAMLMGEAGVMTLTVVLATSSMVFAMCFLVVQHDDDAPDDAAIHVYHGLRCFGNFDLLQATLLQLMHAAFHGCTFFAVDRSSFAVWQLLAQQYASTGLWSPHEHITYSRRFHHRGDDEMQLVHNWALRLLLLLASMFYCWVVHHGDFPPEFRNSFRNPRISDWQYAPSLHAALLPRPPSLPQLPRHGRPSPPPRAPPFCTTDQHGLRLPPPFRTGTASATGRSGSPHPSLLR